MNIQEENSARYFRVQSEREQTLDILFRGVDLLTDNHTYTHNYSINNIVVITHKIDELNILWATNILSM